MPTSEYTRCFRLMCTAGNMHEDIVNAQKTKDLPSVGQELSEEHMDWACKEIKFENVGDNTGMLVTATYEKAVQ